MSLSADLNKRMNDLFVRGSALDDAEFLLANNLARIKDIARQYGVSVADFLYSIIDPATVAKITENAARDYAASLARQIKSGALKKQVLNRRALVDSVLATWRAQADGIAKTIEGNLFAKAAQFKALSIAAQLPLQRVSEIGENVITSTNIAGTQYNYNQLSDLWKRMNASYGTRDTLQFRNGVNYPLRSYVDARRVTTDAETHRMATVVEASADGVWFGTTNKTGTTDSCIYSEGSIFFMNDEARTQAVAKYGNLPEFARMRTWPEIVADKTHMGKFNCRHIVRPVPIQFFSDDKALKEIQNNLPRAIPKKIDERKIFEDVTGRKFEDNVIRPEKPSYAPLPPQGGAPQRYTVA